MKIGYTVHSVANDMIDAQVEYQGETVTAKVPVITVELIADDPGQSNPVLRIRPADEAELAQWARGARIVGTFEPETVGEEASE